MTGNYRVDLTNVARKDLRALDNDVAARVAQRVISLAQNPFAPGTKKLEGRPGYRVRVGDYRIIFDVDTKARAVVVRAIVHRSQAYR